MLRLGSPLLSQVVEEVVRQLHVEETDKELLRYLRGEGNDDAGTHVRQESNVR
ncbi:hypothetical protein [Streptomyces pseudogriseolus]|uniref:hypothetical protein n=1 Tax=Streptomyces pseudogriseolus TaxID=36817 RepID=UPI003FA27E9C